jgi:hypothetical protein
MGVDIFALIRMNVPKTYLSLLKILLPNKASKITMKIVNKERIDFYEKNHARSEFNENSI